MLGPCWGWVMPHRSTTTSQRYLANKDAHFDEIYARLRQVQSSDADQLLSKADTKPVICFDALLPGQVLQGRSTDETFAQLLQTVGLGGFLGMVSLDWKQRQVRRDGVVCQLTVVDAPAARASPFRPLIFN